MEYNSRLGNLHGGCVATLIDICSSFGILVTSGKPWSLIGISTDLSVAYLRGVAEGEKLRIVCEPQRVGKTLANIYTKIYDSQNRLCYSGAHTKFNIDARL
jgi:acyl-coenzyme A thioesterase 13